MTVRSHGVSMGLQSLPPTEVSQSELSFFLVFSPLFKKLHFKESYTTLT